MNFKKITIVCIATALSLSSCSKDESNEVVSLGPYEKGVIILNEGNFGKTNSEISFIAKDNTVSINNAYQASNVGSILGGVAQNYNTNGTSAYVVMNGSNTIQVMNKYTLKSIATISQDLKNPRYIVFANGKGYVTNWGDGGNALDDYIAVINLNTNSVESKIPVAEGPEKLIAYNNNLYVAHKGGFGSGNTVSVIDLTTATVKTTIAVGDVPTDIQENQGTIYLLCNGKPAWTQNETAGKLQKINPATNLVSTTLQFSLSSHPSNMDIEGNKIYYTQGKDIFAMTPSDATLPTQPIFSTSFSVNGFAVNGVDLYISDAGDYKSDGKVGVYDVSGNLKYSVVVGITPSSFYFNN